MKRYFEWALLGIIMSLYIFPLTFFVFPIANSKMILALIGLFLAITDAIKGHKGSMWSDIFIMIVMASIISLFGLMSMWANGTNDSAYASYLVSMLVWLSGSYCVCRAIRHIRGIVTINLICYYFIAVCVFQCIMALVIDFVPVVKDVVDSFIAQDQVMLTKGKRLYGLGASLDTAGIRFALGLMMIVYLMCDKSYRLKQSEGFILIVSYCIITIVGSMVARTTLVGLAVSLVIFLYLKHGALLTYRKSLFLTGTFVVILGSLLIVYLYNNNEDVYNLIRFGLEPFFNYIEGGDFATTSNQMLKNMYVFPDNVKTWVIGDGYFENPNTHDPYYVGQSSIYGYYMGTDVGYLRLIFYFGLVGLLAFISFLGFVTHACCTKMPRYKTLFVSILIMGFIIWLKVATDVFFVMALMICATNMECNNLKIESV
jgi:hypothetical protein